VRRGDEADDHVSAYQSFHQGRRATPAANIISVSERIIARLKPTQPTSRTVELRGPCAPMTSACSMSAVFEGPAMKTP
jgi:hypothetical protein